MAARTDTAAARTAEGSLSFAWPASLREAGFLDRPLAEGPGGFGPLTPRPERRGGPEPPQRPPPKWLQQLIRAVSVGSGAATLLFLVYQSVDPAMSARVDLAFGLPGAMLIAMFAIVLIALGLGD